MVTHMWITIADNEYGWPRLLRLRVYYDGSPDPERRRAARRLLRGRPRLRGQGQVADDRQQLRRAGAQQLLADAVQEVVPHHGHQRGPPPRGEPLLPRRLVEAPVAAREHAVLPRALPAVAARARRRLELRVPEREGQGPLRRHGALGRPGGGGLVRRGRRVLLGRRREEAVDRGHRQRGLLQRRLGPPRQRRPVLRGHGGGGHRPRLAHDGVPLAPRSTRCRSRSR